MFCESCGKELNDEAKFCKFCGTSVVIATSLSCSNCGHKLGVDDKFCESCGSKVDGSLSNNALIDITPKCQNCGNKITDGDNFCDVCGTKVGQLETTETNVKIKRVPTKTVDEVLAMPQCSRKIGNLLLSYGDINNTTLLYGKTPLMLASEEGNLDIVKALIEAGADISIKDSQDCTALVYACLSGNAEIVKALIDEGLDINVADNSSYTPLMRASERGLAEVVKVLLESGANIHAIDSARETAFMKAGSNGHREVVAVFNSYCQNCGNKIKEGDNFCDVCGIKSAK